MRAQGCCVQCLGGNHLLHTRCILHVGRHSELCDECLENHGITLASSSRWPT